MRTPASYSHLEVVTRSGHRLIIPYPSSFGAPDGNFVRFLDGRKHVMLTVAIDDFSYSLARNKAGPGSAKSVYESMKSLGKTLKDNAPETPPTH